MYALISDVHSNLEALQVVLDDIDALGIETVFCLGDVVGYGPDPIACVDLLRARGIRTILGNHEQAVLEGPHAFSLFAARAIHWTQEQLRPGLLDFEAKRRWTWLEGLERKFMLGIDLFVHGSPRDPTSEYMLQQDVDWDHEKLSEVFALVQRLAFCGHTHQPGVITDRREWLSPEQLGGRFEWPAHTDGKAVINVGSVGQPRDEDPRACYAVVAGDAVSWRRIPYDAHATLAKIEANPHLADVLGKRLLLGR